MTAGVALAGAELAQPASVERGALAEPVLAVAAGGQGDTSLVWMGEREGGEVGRRGLSHRKANMLRCFGCSGATRWPGEEHTATGAADHTAPTDW